MNKDNQKNWQKWVAKNLVTPIHRSTVSDRRIQRLTYHLNQLLPQKDSLIGLDVGSGSGELAHHLEVSHANLKMIGVDVLVRKDTAIKVIHFDGDKLPFENESYDFVMLIDVLHHTHAPIELLRECVRVSRQFILIKDHICDSERDRVRLSFMDWVGNRGHDVNLPYNYLSNDQWNKLYQKAGLICENNLSKLGLYSQPFSLIFDSSLHFIAKLTKI